MSDMNVFQAGLGRSGAPRCGQGTWPSLVAAVQG